MLPSQRWLFIICQPLLYVFMYLLMIRCTNMLTVFSFSLMLWKSCKMSEFHSFIIEKHYNIIYTIYLLHVYLNVYNSICHFWISPNKTHSWHYYSTYIRVQVRKWMLQATAGMARAEHALRILQLIYAYIYLNCKLTPGRTLAKQLACSLANFTVLIKSGVGDLLWFVVDRWSNLIYIIQCRLMRLV